MKYVDEFRDGDRARGLVARIHREARHPWVLMEICGGQTHSILKSGLDRLLPETVTLVHGPGCPVCVTPLDMIDRAHRLATRPEVVFTSFGDMLRVPGSNGSLLSLRARGADVRVVYSPLDAVMLARKTPDRQVVFFAVGFETTAPANAMAALEAKRLGVNNFSMLVSHVLVPPAITAMLASPDNRVDAYLGPGHVAAIAGCGEYRDLVARFHVPIVITGFEPVDILEGVAAAITQLENGRAEVENCYRRMVSDEGNTVARAAVEAAFEVCDRSWRGIGVIPASGLRLRAALAVHDAQRRFPDASETVEEPKECISGLVLLGQKRPTDCPAFGTRCTPEHPLGATMVSAEGACSAYHAMGRAAEAHRGSR